MVITREQLIKRLAKETGFWQKNIRIVLDALEETALSYFEEATEEEFVALQVTRGIKIGCKIVPQRERIHPTTRLPMICPPQTKLFAKFGDGIRGELQQRYESKQQDKQDG